MEHNENILLSSVKILFIEDELEAREELYKYLKRRVGKVFAAENGLQGLELYHEQKPDIIIADLYMPQMSGLELIKEIRRVDSNCPIIITTAVNDIDVILKSVDLGINKYIIKPIDPIELLDAITNSASKIAAVQNENPQPLLYEHKKKLEDEIKKEFSAFLKATTGKGPRDIHVFILKDMIEIQAYDVLTLMEKNMIDNHKNSAIIEQNRKLFYSIKEDAICEMIFNILQIRTQIKRIDVNTEKGTNKIILSIL